MVEILKDQNYHLIFFISNFSCYNNCYLDNAAVRSSAQRTAAAVTAVEGEEEQAGSLSTAEDVWAGLWEGSDFKKVVYSETHLSLE